MTHYRLRDGISFCRIDDAALFLDVAGDRYFRLGADAECAFLTLIDHPDEPASSLSAGLQDIVTATDDHGHPLAPAVAALPATSLLEAAEEDSHHAIGAIVPTVLCLSAAAWLLRYRGFARALRYACCPCRPSRARSQHDKMRLAHAFLHWRRLVPLTPVCLLDSLALTHYLRRAGVPVQLVIAVSLFPFAAHCWVQDADLLFNDTLDHAAAYTPILVR